MVIEKKLKIKITGPLKRTMRVSLGITALSSFAEPVEGRSRFIERT